MEDRDLMRETVQSLIAWCDEVAGGLQSVADSLNHIMMQFKEIADDIERDTDGGETKEKDFANLTVKELLGYCKRAGEGGMCEADCPIPWKICRACNLLDDALKSGERLPDFDEV